MSTIYNNYKPYHYGIDGIGKVATDFFPLEKTAKITYRMIDLAHILTERSAASMVCLSSQIKDLVLFIESTRLPCVSLPLFFRDEKGLSFFQKKPWQQCAEKVSLSCHLVLKTLFGAEKTGLIRLGIIGTYAIGNMTAFRWAVEGTIWTYNLFGILDGTNALANAKSELEKFQPYSSQNDLLFNHQKAALKIAAKVSKLILITFAVSAAILNVSGLLCQTIILSLGMISDGIGLAGFYHHEYGFKR